MVLPVFLLHSLLQNKLNSRFTVNSQRFNSNSKKTPGTEDILHMSSVPGDFIFSNFSLAVLILSYDKVAKSSFTDCYSSKSGVEKYLSAVSGRIVTIRFPGPKSSAIRIAAATLVPEEIPHMIPSLEASSLDVSIAS